MKIKYAFCDNDNKDGDDDDDVEDGDNNDNNNDNDYNHNNDTENGNKENDNQILPDGAKSLPEPVLTQDHWHTPRGIYTDYKQTMVAKFISCTCQSSMC